MHGVKIGAGIAEAGDGTISVNYASLIPVGASWTGLGTATGTFTATNTTGHVVMYAFTGGNWTGGSPSDNRGNTINLQVAVNGLAVGNSSNNNDSDAKSGFVITPVPPGSTVTCTSNPFSAPAPGTFSIASFIGLMN